MTVRRRLTYSQLRYSLTESVAWLSRDPRILAITSATFIDYVKEGKYIEVIGDQSFLEHEVL